MKCVAALTLLGVALVVGTPAPDDELPRPRFVVLGQQGVGKSSLGNALLGIDNTLDDARERAKSPFKIGHKLKSKTQFTTFSQGHWLGNETSPTFTIVDTPGFKDTDDAEFIEELTSVLGDEVKEVDGFIVVFKYKDRFTQPFERTMKMIAQMFGGDFWRNVIIDVSFWDAATEHVEEKLNQVPSVTKASYEAELRDIFRHKFREVTFDLPIVFLDAYYTRANEEEVEFFNEEVDKLWAATQNKKAYSCKTRKEVQAELDAKQNKLALLKQKERMKRAKLRRRIAELEKIDKECKARVDFYTAQCPNVTIGCSWSEWGEWGVCSGGERRKTRSRMPGPDASCDGEDTQTEAECSSHTDQWWEDQQTMAVIIGGTKGGLAARDVNIMKGTGLCNIAPPIPLARDRMAVAYTRDPGMVRAGTAFILACGGMPIIGAMASQACWKLDSAYVGGEWTGFWEQVTSMNEAVAGAAMAWYQNQMWVIGGAKGDDKSNNVEISDKVQIYNPSTNAWSLGSTFPRQVNRACAVSIDSSLVVTGGTKKKVTQAVRLHGKRDVNVFTGTAWDELPNMIEYRAGHGCDLTHMGGHLGIVVAGGSNSGDSVEFLDWDTKNKWVKMHRLHRQRRFGLGLAHVGGKLTAVGGYNWPSAVSEVEQKDENSEDWGISPIEMEGRMNHGIVTVPGVQFPQCHH